MFATLLSQVRVLAGQVVQGPGSRGRGLNQRDRSGNRQHTTGFKVTSLGEVPHGRRVGRPERRAVG